MVYKKYIKRGGKTFGPYFYKSIKKEGKVITEYVGRHDVKNSEKTEKTAHSEKSNKRLFVASILLGVAVVALLIYLAIVIQFGSTGKVSLDIQENYNPGDQIKGTLNLILKHGELFPADSKLMIDNAGDSSEFSLINLVSGDMVNGSFYVENKSVSGSGQGFGIEGQKEIYPSVSFSFKVISSEEIPLNITKPINGTNVSGGNATVNVSENVSGGGFIPNNESTNEATPQTNESVNVTIEPSANETITEPANTTSETPPTQPTTTTETPSETPQTPTTGQETPPSTTEIPSTEAQPGTTESSSQTTSESSTSGESTGTSTGSENSGITGGAITEQIIEAEVVKNQPYEYNLNLGETIEIVNSSHPVSFEIKDGKAVVTTDYYETQKGFGQDYLTNDSLTIPINISSLNLTARPGILKFSFVYSGEELTSSSKEITVTAQNLTNITTQNFTLETNITQFDAVLGQPVKWEKRVKVILGEDANSTNGLVIDIPNIADQVSVKKISSKGEEEVDASVNNKKILRENKTKEEVNDSENVSLASPSLDVFNESSNESNMTVAGGSVITGNAIEAQTNQVTSENAEVQINQEINNNDEIVVEYETPAPYSVEKEMPGGERVMVVGPETVHYENVSIFANISESLHVQNPGSVTIFWVEKNVFIPVQDIQDTDNNGIYDYVKWIAPELSNQTFDIIVITKAEHLDSNRVFISDIYNETKELDGVWSETIPSGDYVRVTFEQNLTSKNDITLYPRVVNGTPRIEVYEKNGNNTISEFTNLTSNEYNKVFLTGLPENYSQDTFDLRVLDGDIELDHIVDPILPKGEFFEDCVSITDWYYKDSNGWSAPDANQQCFESTKATTKIMIYGPLDLSNSSIRYANISWDSNNSLVDVNNEWLRIDMNNTDSPSFVNLYPYDQSTQPSHQERNISATLRLTSGMYIKVVCQLTNSNGRACRLDNINITSYRYVPSPPNVSLISPPDNYVFSSSQANSANFSCNATSSDFPLSNISLYTNTTGTWQINKTKSDLSPLGNVTDFYTTYYLGNGVYRTIFQPNGTYGKDVYVLDHGTTPQAGIDNEYLEVGLSASPPYDYLSFLEFNITSLINMYPSINVLNSSLTLVTSDGNFVNLVGLGRVKWGWEESTLNSSNMPSVDSSIETQNITGSYQYLVYNSTAFSNLVRSWINGSNYNSGIRLIRAAGGSTGVNRFIYSSDMLTLPSYWPKLIIDYQLNSAKVDFNVSEISQGVYAWNCQAIDINNNAGFAVFNRTFFVDPCLPPSVGDWNITQNCVLINRQVSLADNTNLNILSGGNLTLINTTLYLKPLSGNGSSNIAVYSGGRMNISSNSQIKSFYTNRFGFVVNSGSNFSMTNSNLSDVGWADVQGQRGLELLTTVKNFSGNTLSNNYYGISFYSNSNSILNNSFLGNNRGISVYSSNNNVTNNTINSNSQYGAYLDQGKQNNTLLNNVLSNNNFGIILYDSSYTNISNNTIKNSAGNAIYLIGISGNAVGNIFSYNSIFDNAGAGVGGDTFYKIFHNNIFYRNTIINNSVGLDFQNGFGNVPYDNLIIDSVIVNNTVHDIENSGTNNTFINTAFNKSKVLVDDGYITVKWYLDVNVSSYQGPVNASNVTSWNVTHYPNGIPDFSNLTNESGFIPRQTLTEYVQNITSPFYFYSTNYTINATNANYLNYSGKLNLTQSAVLNIALHALNQYDTCSPTFSGANLIINKSVSCSNMVIEINSLNVTSTGSFILNNVTLIVKNTTIAFGGSLNNINSKSTIWQNGNLTINGNYTLQNSTLRINGTGVNGNIGILVKNSGNININESSNITNGENASYRYFFVVNSGSNFSMTDSALSYAGWADVQGQRGLEINTTVRNFSRNIVSNFCSLIFYSSNNLISNNTFNKGNYSIYYTSSDNNSIIGNYIDFSSYNGIKLYLSNNNTIKDNIINNTNQAGVSFTLSKNNLVSGNKFIYGDLGISLEWANPAGCNTASSGNTFINNSVLNNNLGIRAYSEMGNKFIDSLINFSNSYDVQLVDNQYCQGELLFLNTSFNKSKVDFSGFVNGTFKAQWYLDVNATNKAGGPLNEINVSAYNRANALYFSVNTLPSGFIPRQNVTEYVQNSSGINYWTNYTVNASKLGYYNNYSTSLNLTQSTRLDIIMNTWPVVYSIVLNSSSGKNITIDNLSVYYNSSDDDLDKITNITDWRVNGTSIAVLNLPFDTQLNGVNSIVKDYSTLGNNCILGNTTQGTAPIWNTAGKVGGAYEFDGLGDVINCSNSLSLDLNKTLTIGVWIKPAMKHETGNNYGVISKALSPGWSWQLRFGAGSGASNRLGFQFNNGSLPGLWVNIDRNLTVGQWYYVVGTYNGTHASIYLNGVLNETKILPMFIKNSSVPLLIGNEGWPGNFFNGTIDDLKIYNRSLSPEQISLDYLAGLAGKSSDKISENETNIGDVWQTALTPNDALTDGATVLSNNLTILTSPPAVANVTLNSSSRRNATIDNLSVYYNAYDDEGSPITNITDWRSNGSSIAVLNMPFDTQVNGVNSSIKDYSTLGNKAVLGGKAVGTNPIWVPNAKIGGGYNFDGVNDIINVSYNSSIPYNSNLDSDNVTISVWIKINNFTSPSGLKGIVARENNNDAFNIFLDNTGKINFYVRKGITWYSFSSSAVLAGQWYHIVLTHNSTGTLKGFVNGASVGTTTNAIPVTRANSSIVLGYYSTVYFNGTIDDLRIYNRTLSPEQISLDYLAGLAGKSPEVIVSKELRNKDVWQVALTPNDAFQDGITVLSNNLTIFDHPPNITNVFVNTSTGLNRSSEDLNCYANISDLGDSQVYANYSWYNDTGLVLSSQSLVDSNKISLISTLPENYTKKRDNWTCSVQAYDGSFYEGHWNNATIFIRNTPPNITLISPSDNNVTNNRTPLFVWNGSDSDGKSDIKNYSLNITLFGGGPVSCSDQRALVISNLENYITDPYLNCLIDDLYYYNWTVRAYDGEDYSNWATPRRLDIQSLVSINLTRNKVNFGMMNQNEINDTTNDNPLPFLMENDGNVFVNVTLNASSLWDSPNINPTNYFQYKIDNSSETNSFNYGQSKISWTNVPNSASFDWAIIGLNWSNANDSLEVDIKVQAPSSEYAGQKSSLMTFMASRSDPSSGGLPVFEG